MPTGLSFYNVGVSPRAGAAEFDEVSTVYDETLPAHVIQHYLKKRVAFFRRVFPEGARLIDVGCGTAILSAALRDAGFRMAGVDASAGMLSHAVRRRVPAALAHVDRLPFRDNTFDGAVSVAVLHHLRTPELVRSAIAEMLRVTRPGGSAVIWDHNPLNPYWPLLMRRIPQDRGDERLVSYREIEAAVSAAGGQVVGHERLGFVPDFVPPAALSAAARLERALERFPLVRSLAAHNVAVASKR